MRLVLDIETICSDRFLGIDETSKRIIQMAARRQQEIETMVALSPPMAEVVCVGMLNLDTGNRCAIVNCAGAETLEEEGLKLVGCTSERDLLLKTSEVLAKATHLVTFNGRNFDLPVLIHRSKALGVEPAPFLMRAANEPRYKPMIHTDLLEVFTFGGASQRQSLEAYAIGYGLENPKAAGDGSNMAELVAGGEARKLAEYCLGDVVATAKLFWRWRS